MNKKGFTLVEILAVIVILSLVITITATKGFGAFDNTKNKITEQNKKAIKEGAKVLITEVENCDDDLEDYEDLCDVFNIENCGSCDELKENINTKGVAISISTLKEKNYISGNDLDDIDGTISILFDKDNNTGSVVDVNINDDNATYTPKVYTFTSNNQLLDDTTAKTSISFTPKEDGKLSFNWNVKSETDYDKLTIKLNDIVLVNKKSGMNVSGNIEENIEKDKPYKLELIYEKDSSTSYEGDTAMISNLKITSRLKNGLNIENDDYYFEKSETVVNNK